MTRDLRARLLPLFFIVAGLATVPAVEPVSFSRQIAPLLVDKCVECHREAKSKGGYRLDTFDQLLKTGDSGEPAVVVGAPDRSELLRRIVTDDEDERMPPKGDPLEKAEVNLLRQWLEQGGKFDGPSRMTRLAELAADHGRKVQTPKSYPRSWPVTALAAGAGGLVASSGYGEVLLWEATTGKLAARIGGMPERIASLAWHGNTLAVAGGSPGRSGEVWLVDAASRKAVKRVVATSDTVQVVTISQDGRWLAAGGTDNTIRLLALPDGKNVWEAEAHADWIMALAFSPDGKHLATGSRDRSARVFDVAKGEALATHDGHSAAVLSLIFIEDGKQILSGDAVGELRRWKLDGTADKSTATRPGRDAVLASIVGAGRIFLSLADKGLMELNVKDKKIVRSFEGHASRVNALAFLPEPPRLISGSHDGMVIVWDLKENKELARFAAKP